MKKLKEYLRNKFYTKKYADIQVDRLISSIDKLYESITYLRTELSNINITKNT